MKKLFFCSIALLQLNLCFSQEISRTFYPDQLKQDVAILQQALTNLHPGLYKFNTKQQIENLFKDLNKKLTKPLNEKAFYLLLAKFTEKIGCGHTYLNPWNFEENVATQYMPKNVLPFCFEVIDSKFIITHNLTENNEIVAGTEIVKINGIPTRQVIDSLLQVSRADGRNALGKKLSNLAITTELIGNYSLTDIFMPLFFENTSNEFQFELKTIQNKILTQKSVAFTLANRKQTFIKKYGAIATNENLIKIKMLDDATCYFQIGTFAVYGKNNFLFKKIDSLFSGLQTNKKIKNLIIDIRKTEGGNTEARDYLLQYLLPKDFDANEYNENVFHAFLEIPLQIKPFLYTWNKQYFEPKPASVFTKNHAGWYENRTGNKDGSENISDFKIKENSFRGNIVLMTSPINSSVAFEVARIFQLYKTGVIVGEQTGGTKNGINGGRSFFLRLPYSRIEIDVPILYQAHLNDPDEGISPDYSVKQTQIDIANGNDAQLKFVKDLLKKP